MSCASRLSMDRHNAKRRKRYAEDEEYRKLVLDRARKWRLRHPKPIRDRTKNKTYDMVAYEKAYKPIRNARNRERYRIKKIKQVIPLLLKAIMYRNVQ